MPINGSMSIAKALSGLENAHRVTTLSVDGSAMETMFSSIEIDAKDTKALDEAEAKAAIATENATTGNKKEAIKAAEDHEKYKVLSTEMNQQMGEESTQINLQMNMVNTENSGLGPAYGAAESLLEGNKVTSSDICRFRG